MKIRIRCLTCRCFLLVEIHPLQDILRRGRVIQHFVSPTHVHILDALVHLKWHKTPVFVHLVGHTAVLGSESRHTNNKLVPSVLVQAELPASPESVSFSLYDMGNPR